MGITQEIRPVPKKLGQARFSGVSNPIFSVTRLTVNRYMQRIIKLIWFWIGKFSYDLRHQFTWCCWWDGSDSFDMWMEAMEVNAPGPSRRSFAIVAHNSRPRPHNSLLTEAAQRVTVNVSCFGWDRPEPGETAQSSRVVNLKLFHQQS